MKQYELSALLDGTKGIVISYRVSVENPTPDLEQLEKALKTRRKPMEKVRFCMKWLKL